MTDDLSEAFARADRGIVVAPAGCGKTELIVNAVTQHAKGRQLVLTHTHAGVRALRNRFLRAGTGPPAFRVDTIAGFALRYAAAFPTIGGCEVTEPKTNEDYQRIYDACAHALTNRHIRDTVSGTYSGVFVDEYQDCTVRHHAIVKELATFLPCRVVGDDLQGIFGFADDPLADWNGDVLGYFTLIGELDTPHRWTKTNPALGEWLNEVRLCLRAGRAIDLDGYWKRLPCSRYAVPCQVAECKRALALDGRVVVIRKWDREVYAIGKMLKGAYGCMEEVECRDLTAVCRRLDEAAPSQRPAILLDFARQCLTAVPAVVRTLQACAESSRAPPKKTSSAYPGLCGSLKEVAEQDSLAASATVLDEIANLPDARLHRKELFFELRKTAINYRPGEDESLQMTAWRIRESARRTGRRLPKRLVSRTVLIKGLEFDHVLLPDVDDFDGAKDLYVALTRASKSVLVLSHSGRITRPQPCAAS